MHTLYYVKSTTDVGEGAAGEGGASNFFGSSRLRFSSLMLMRFVSPSSSSTSTGYLPSLHLPRIVPLRPLRCAAFSRA